MFVVFDEGNFLFQKTHLPIHPHTGVAGLGQIGQQLLVLALFAADDRRQDVDAHIRGMLQNLVDHLVNGLPLDGLAAFHAVGDARPAKRIRR